MVLFNHTKEYGYSLFVWHRESILYPFYICNSVFIKIAVPLFFMISGALLLERDENYLQVVKRFLKYLIILFIASFISFCYESFRNHAFSFSFLDFIRAFYSKPTATGLWYLYAYLAYILMLPLLRLMAKSLDKKSFCWLLLMHGIISGLPVFEYFIWRGSLVHYSAFSFFISNNYIIYPLMGYYVDQKIKINELESSRIIVLWVITFISIIISAMATHLYCTDFNDWEGSACEKFFNNLIFIPAGTVFISAKRFFAYHVPKEKAQRIISNIGGATFGLYLIENICRREASYVLRFLKGFPPLISCWIWVAAAYLIGVIFVLLLKRIPWIKKFI